MNKTTEQTLREALAFYADPANWTYANINSTLLMDQGKVARKALDATAEDNTDRQQRQSDYLDNLAASAIPGLLQRIERLENSDRAINQDGAINALANRIEVVEARLNQFEALASLVNSKITDHIEASRITTED